MKNKLKKHRKKIASLLLCMACCCIVFSIGTAVTANATTTAPMTPADAIEEIFNGDGGIIDQGKQVVNNSLIPTFKVVVVVAIIVNLVIIIITRKNGVPQPLWWTLGMLVVGLIVLMIAPSIMWDLVDSDTVNTVMQLPR